MGAVRDFVVHHYRHFNAAVLVDAARAWEEHLQQGGKMLLTMGGAMSTAELGLVVAELIRQNKVHALCVTGANLEEDVFNLVAHDEYKRIPLFRELSAADDKRLLEQHLNRVTDTCIPEEAAMRKVDRHMLQLWKKAEESGERRFPHEFFYELLLSKVLEAEYQIDPKGSWLLAAAQQRLPIWVPGWEDSTLGNSFVSEIYKGSL
jgi:deoxyhypusine synthase